MTNENGKKPGKGKKKAQFAMYVMFSLMPELNVLCIWKDLITGGQR